MNRFRKRLKKALAKIFTKVTTPTDLYGNNLVKKLLAKGLIRVATKEDLIRVVKLEDIYGSNLKKLHPIPPETISTPEVKQMTLDSWFNNPQYIQGETYTTPEIFTTVLEEVLYCPENDILLTKNREIIFESVIFDRMFINRKKYDLKKIYLKKVEKISGYCSIFRGIPNEYFHKLADNIPRVYLLNQPEYADIKEIKLLCPEPVHEVEQFLIPKLTPSNVSIVPVSTDRLYSVDKLIFLSFLTRWPVTYLPSPYLEKLRTEVLPPRPRKKKNRIYISRIKCVSAAKKRHILNEEELFNELSKIGFEKYILEDISIADKVELFYDAEIVVSPHGAGMAHIMFSEKIKVIDLLPSSSNCSPYFYYLCKSLGHQYHYLCADEPTIHHNFVVDIPKVMELLSDLKN